MTSLRSSLKRRLRQLALAAAVLAAPSLALAEDIDLYTGAPVNGGSPNLLILLDSASAWSGNVTFTCPSTSYVSANNAGKDVGFEQCSLYQAVTGIGNNPVLLGNINMGLMLFDPSSNGGIFKFPSKGRATDPGPLPVMNATGIANFLAAIKSVDRQADASNNSAVGGGMQEMWAYFAGKTGLSGATYKSPLNGPCQKNFVLYIANAMTNGKPQDGSNSPSALSSLKQVLGLTTNPPQIVIPVNGKYQANWGDEWAQFMYQTDLSGGTSSNPQNIITYTIAVTDGKNPDYVQFLQSMSSHGGGKAFVVNINDADALNQLVNDLQQVFNEVQSINSVFASVSLPVSVNSQGVSLNQIYIGTFRPDPNALPRWVGNLKQYQLGADSNNAVITVDSLGNPAISNNGSGFISPNALSYWSADHQTGTPRDGPKTFPAGTSVVANWPTTGFWTNKPSGVSQSYDAVDGEVVEKGGVAEMLRADYLTAQTGRTVLTCNGVGNCPTSTAMPAFNTSNSSLTATALGTTAADLPNLINWVRGTDNTNPNNETEPGPGGLVTIRPSIHGDVLHSRPAIINYGGSTGIVVFYGSNDGYYRAINGNQTTGIGNVRPGGELWSFIAPEFFGKLKRQRDNYPKVALPGITDSVTPPQPKDYFFDGTTTVYQDTRASSNRTYIYLTTRRGGRFMYAMDVTTPTAPRFLWKRSNTDIAELGQTWSQPKVALIKGNANPVLIMGGGYDPAEDVDPVQNADTMGRAIIVLDAVNGNVVWMAAPSCAGQAASCLAVPGMKFAIPSDVSLLDRDGDGYIERLYVGDLGGNVWRVDLETAGGTTPLNWTVTRLANIGGTGTNARKFFYPPDVVPTTSYDAVIAASGDREHPLASNAASSVVNRFYVFRDTNTGKGITGSWSTITESNLVDATSSLYTGTGSDSGFFVTLTNPGEKAVNAPLTVAGYTYFGTNQPANPVNNPNMCYPNLGIARGYAISFLDGSGINPNRFVQFDGGGMPPSPIFGVVQMTNSLGATVLTPVLIGAGNQTGLVGGNNTSTLGSQKVVPPGTGKRKRTYWYIEGAK